MSPLRGSGFGSIDVLQRCHPYGVEEEIGQNRGEKHRSQEAAEVSGPKTLQTQKTKNIDFFRKLLYPIIKQY